MSRTRRQLRESTLREYGSAMRAFIEITGNIDYQRVKHEHGERFLQACLDGGNAPATAKKKLQGVKRVFQLAVDRGQLEQNPLRRVRQLRVPEREIHTYSDEECIRFIKAARDSRIGWPLRWDLLIHLALCTGMRRGELLNLTWRDIDFEAQKVHVSPKENTEYTWEWHIKDTDRRKLPSTDELVQLLAEHQAAQPDGYPYVFVPPRRYDRIQKVRQQGKWTARKGNYPLNNFDRQFRSIRCRAGIDPGEFHDFRRTCITNWFANGLSEYEVMKMAGHASFETTRRFYLAVREDLVDRARAASSQALERILIADCLHGPSGGLNSEGVSDVSD